MSDAMQIRCQSFKRDHTEFELQEGPSDRPSTSSVVVGENEYPYNILGLTFGESLEGIQVMRVGFEYQVRLDINPRQVIFFLADPCWRTIKVVRCPGALADDLVQYKALGGAHHPVGMLDHVLKWAGQFIANFNFKRITVEPLECVQLLSQYSGRKLEKLRLPNCEYSWCIAENLKPECFEVFSLDLKPTPADMALNYSIIAQYMPSVKNVHFDIRHGLNLPNLIRSHLEKAFVEIHHCVLTEKPMQMIIKDFKEGLVNLRSLTLGVEGMPKTSKNLGDFFGKTVINDPKREVSCQVIGFQKHLSFTAGELGAFENS